MPTRFRKVNLGVNFSRASGPHGAVGAQKGGFRAVFGLFLVPNMAVALTIIAQAATENVAETGV